MLSWGDWLSVFKSRTFYFIFAAATALALVIWLWAKCCSCLDLSFCDMVRYGESCWHILSWSDVFWILAGSVLGLIPGALLIAYAHFKAMTRYFGDTAEEAAEKAAYEKLKVAYDADALYEHANRAGRDAGDALKEAEKAALEADAEAKNAPQDAEKAKRAMDAGKKKEDAEKAFDTAWNKSVEAANATIDSKKAYQVASAKADEVKKGVGTAKASHAAAASGNIARDNARAAANKAAALAQEAVAKSNAAKEVAVKAAEAARLTNAEAKATHDTKAAADAAKEVAATAKKAAMDAEIEAKAAEVAAANAVEDAADRVRDLRSTILNPEGLQKATLEKAGKIRQQEWKGFIFLAIMLVGICWVTFSVCWGGWLQFTTTIKQETANTALQLSCAGAYLYVLILLGRRSFQQDITPSSVLWCCVTLAVGPVLALVLAYVWIDANPNKLAPLNDNAIFFFAGLAPRHVTALLLELLRRAMLAATGKPTLNLRSVPLQQVRGVTPEVEERLEEEGIFDAVNLAMADPLRLLRNTSYDKFQILTWIDEAFLISIFPQHWQALENEGITGVMDMAWYITCLEDTEPLADRVKLDKESLKKTVQRLSEDAQVQLIWILYDLDNPNPNE